METTRSSASRMLASSRSSIPQCYRPKERNRIVSSLLSGSGILIAGRSGMGKSMLAHFVSQELQSKGYAVVEVHQAPEKQMLITIANQVGAPLRDIEGSKLTTAGLKESLRSWLVTHTAILICDDADLYPRGFRLWLKDLVRDQQPMAIFATNPLRRDIFQKLPELILDPLPESVIRGVIQQEARSLRVSLNASQITGIVYQSGGNPDEALRLVRALHLGIVVTAAEDDDTLDATPFVLALITGLAVLRLLGLAYNNTLLYILGGILGLLGIILRQSLNRLPRRSKRIGGAKR